MTDVIVADLSDPSIGDAHLVIADLASDTVTEGGSTIVTLELEGEPGPRGLGELVLEWDVDAYPARPDGLPAGLARYIGPEEPTDWLEGDRWDDTSG